eukprot:5970600-Alexandrium_andersonii.AAC.1
MPRVHARCPACTQDVLACTQDAARVCKIRARLQDAGHTLACLQDCPSVSARSKMTLHVFKMLGPPASRVRKIRARVSKGQTGMAGGGLERELYVAPGDVPA